MGTDCKLVIDDKEIHQLDRWYVFYDEIESDKNINKSVAIAAIERMLSPESLLKATAVVERTLSMESSPKATAHYGADQQKDIKYHRHWLDKALRIIREDCEHTVRFVVYRDVHGGNPWPGGSIRHCALYAKATSAQ